VIDRISDGHCSRDNELVTDHGRAPRTVLPAWRTGALRLRPASLGIATACLIAADWGSRQVGDSVFPGAPLDETAHFVTTLLIFWALGRGACRRFLAPALVASVMIDVDHLPARFGTQWLTAGTPRPYTHSLLTIAVMLGIALLWGRRRDLWLGVAIGLAIHLWRDMGEGSAGVSLLWPFSDQSFQYPHSVYVAVMAAAVVIAAARCRGPWLRGRRGAAQNAVRRRARVPRAATKMSFEAATSLGQPESVRTQQLSQGVGARCRYTDGWRASHSSTTLRAAA
jgi:inner membrane protein